LGPEVITGAHQACFFLQYTQLLYKAIIVTSQRQKSIIKL